MVTARRSQLLLLGILCGLLVWAAQAIAFDAAILGQAERSIAALRQDLTRIQNQLALPNLTAQQIAEERVALETVRATAIDKSDTLTGPIDEVMQQLASLGAAPAPGQTEAADLTERRKALTNTLDRLNAAKKQLELIAVESDQLVERAATALRNLFFSRIFEAGRSILNPSLWYDGLISHGLFLERLGNLFATWWAQISTSGNLFVLVLVPLILGIFSIVWRRARRLFLARFGSALWSKRAPDDTTRLWRIVRGVIVTAVVSGALVIAIYGAFEIAGIITPRFEAVFGAAADLFFFSSVMIAGANRLISPGAPEWRIVDLDERAARRFGLLASLAAFVVSLTRILRRNCWGSLSADRILGIDDGRERHHSRDPGGGLPCRPAQSGWSSQGSPWWHALFCLGAAADPHRLGAACHCHVSALARLYRACRFHHAPDRLHVVLHRRTIHHP